MSTILVVDDSLTDRCRAAGLLERAGFEVRTASDGEAALERIAESAPDAVVTDLQMPKTDGFTLVTKVVQDYPLIPIVVITSQGSEAIAVRALHAGAASYVPKRDLASHLTSTVRRICLAAGEDRNRARLFDCLVRQDVCYRIETDLNLITPAVATVRELLSQTAWLDGGAAMRSAVAFEEALLNAIYHGNLELNSALREDDPDGYYEAARQRAKMPHFRQRSVLIDIAISRQAVRFRLVDEGAGFDPDLLPDPTDPECIAKASGRGLLLIRTFMDEVVHSAGGREITMVKRPADSSPHAPREVASGTAR